MMRDIILILILQLMYVPMLALRTISMVKKLRVLTAFFGFLESIIYVFGLAIVLTGDQTLIGMLVYAFGFSLGLIVGIQVESKIAIGYVSFLVNIKDKNNQLIDSLRERGYGVTVFDGEGRDGTRYRLDILTKRTQEAELMKLIEYFEPYAFVMAYEPTRFKGGFMEVLMKKQMGLTKRFKPKPLPIDQTDEDIGWFKKTAEGIVSEMQELVVSDEENEPSE
jgi:uncharacterized protein YebE (UPF0316 family)